MKISNHLPKQYSITKSLLFHTLPLRYTFTRKIIPQKKYRKKKFSEKEIANTKVTMKEIIIARNFHKRSRQENNCYRKRFPQKRQIVKEIVVDRKFSLTLRNIEIVSMTEDFH